MKREVRYARTESVNDDTIEAVFFDNEVISWSFYNTRLHGKDGMSPVAGIWKQAHILEQQVNYNGQYFDDDTGNRYPNTLVFVKTSNADAFEKQAQQAKDSRQENAYEQGIILAEDMDLDVQVIDMMNDTILGQSPETRKEYKSEIRTAFGLVDLVDSDEDSASLASGSKGLDVMSRSIQSMRTDLSREVLPEIEEALGLEEWELTFHKEEAESEKMTGLEKAEMAQRLSKAGVSFRIENGTPVLVDTDDPIDVESEETEDVSDDEQDRTDVNL